jgi:hypothetical protein
LTIIKLNNLNENYFKNYNFINLHI